MGLSVGLDTAAKALRAHQLAVDTAAHNIANANSPGFSRQRVLLRPLGVDGSEYRSRDALLGKAGYGVRASDINRVRDIFLDFQVRQALRQQAQWDAHASAIGKLELAFGEPGDDGLATLLHNFWGAWHDVVNDPESAPARRSLVNQTTTLTTRIQRAYSDIVVQREEIDRNVEAMAGRINAATREIADLNFQIKQVELSGDHANDLRDRRDLLLDELSRIANVSYAEQQDKTVTVYLGTHEMVTTNMYRPVAAVPDPAQPGLTKLIHTLDGEDVVPGGGELQGLLEARDVVIPSLLAKLDQLAGGLITQINAIHTTGFGLDGSTGLNFLTGTGAQDIALNPTLATNPAQIATAAAANLPGDASIALQIADLELATTMAAGTLTFDQYYADLVGVLGADVNRASGLAESGGMFVDHLEAMRQSVQGVNIDEEVTLLNASQHAYNAAAKVITVIDEMLDTLINRTGVG
jgi:flagellar hook-associated protein 1 FlgK